MKTAINNMVIFNKDLSDEAFKLYCILAMFIFDNDYYEGYVSISTLAEISDKTPETVQSLIKELMNKKLIYWDATKLLDSNEWLYTPSTFSINQNFNTYVMDYDQHYGYFALDKDILGDILFPEAYALYRIFAMLAGGKRNIVHTSIKQLSELFNKSTRTTKRWLNVLVINNVIEQTAPHTYVIHDSIRDNEEV